MSEDPLDILERIHRDAARLREIGGGSLVITIEAAPPPPAAVPDPPSSPEAAGSCGAQVLELLRLDGPSIVQVLARRLDTPDYNVRAALNKMAAATPATVRRVGEQRGGGRPAIVWEAITQAPTSREVAHEADRAKRTARSAKAGTRKSADAERVLETLQAGDCTVAELADHLPEIARGRFVGILNHLSRAGRVERRGERAGKSVWRRRPLPSEQEDVTIRNGAGAVSRAQVVECLRRGPCSLRELAVELGVRPSDVSLIVGPLEHGGEATRIADGKYRLEAAA